MTANFTMNLVLNSLVSPESISGGDRISIELCKGWHRRGCSIHLFGCKEAHYLCQKDGLKADYHIISDFSIQQWSLFFAYTLRILKSLLAVPKIKESSIIFSSSDFLTDTIPAYRIKRKNKDVKWIAGFYLIAPNPFKKLQSLNLRSLLYFLTQKFSIYLMRKYVDAIFVLNEENKTYLAKKAISAEKIKVVNGGVDLKYISEIKPRNSISYEGCFVGRFHQQKGITDLIKIWEIVSQNKREAKLAIIGWGDKGWQKIIKKEIRNRHLENNIDLLGVLDGFKKIEILKSSKVFLFPSNYESWGVVVCEAMACGLPVIAYELPLLRRIYPMGMVTVPLGEVEEFAKNILNLLRDDILYRRIREEALMVASRYDWSKVADDALFYLSQNSCLKK